MRLLPVRCRPQRMRWVSVSLGLASRFLAVVDAMTRGGDGQVVVANAAWPLESRATAAVPPPAPAMVNVTLPVGTPTPGATAVTVVVNTTGVPAAAGVPLVVTIARLAALATVLVSVALVLGA